MLKYKASLYLASTLVTFGLLCPAALGTFSRLPGFSSEFLRDYPDHQVIKALVDALLEQGQTVKAKQSDFAFWSFGPLFDVVADKSWPVPGSSGILR